MAKVKTRTKYTSKGERVCVSRNIRKSMRRHKSDGEKALEIQKAYLSGKNPWLTIPNPNKSQTNKRFIRVKANDYYGDPKRRRGFMFSRYDSVEGD